MFSNIYKFINCNIEGCNNKLPTTDIGANPTTSDFLSTDAVSTSDFVSVDTADDVIYSDFESKGNS